VKSARQPTTFSRRLKQARERTGLTQTELGLRVGIDPSAASPRMNQYEKGVHEPPHAMVKRLAEELGIPPAFLFTDDDRLAELLLLWTELGPEGHEKLLNLAHKEVGDR
jgi:transcriptional regulator with XRE-family HTH domain